MCLALCPPQLGAQPAAELRWGGDAEGGAPDVGGGIPNYCLASSDSTSTLHSCWGRALGRTPRFIQVGFTSIDAAAARGDFDVGLSGIEDSAGSPFAPRGHDSLLRVPRSADRSSDRQGPVPVARGSPGDIASRRWARRSRTTCSPTHRLATVSSPVTYEDDVHPYSYFVLGRVDAVRARRHPRASAACDETPD